VDKFITESEESYMATTKGRKTTRKKKAEVVEEAPKVEVIEPKAEEPAPEPVQEELPAPPPPVEEPKVEEPPAPAPEPVQEVPAVKEVVKVEKPVQVTASAPQKPVMGVGSIVTMPSGKQGRIIGLSKKGQFRVQKLDNPRKEYIYAPSSLSLVK
jgi:hypothetical protein